MNPIIDALLGRRSIRRYLQKPVSKDIIDTIIHTAIWAPSSMNSQPWHFTVIDNQDMLDEISRIAHEIKIETGMEEHLLDVDPNSIDAHIFYKAPIVIIISGRDDTLSPDPNVDCALAAYTAVLAANSFGLGACITDLYSGFSIQDDAAEMLNLDHHYTPYYGVALGYPDESYPVMAPLRKSDNVSYWES